MAKEEKSGLDKFRDLYLPTVTEKADKFVDTLSYLAGPELTKLGSGILDLTQLLMPLQNVPDVSEFVEDPSLKNFGKLASDTGITALEMFPPTLIASKAGTLPGKVAQEVVQTGTKQTSKKLAKGQVTDALDEIGLENLKNLSVDDVSNLLSSKFGIEASGSTIRAALRSKNVDFKKATEAGGKEITEKGQFKPIEINPTQQESLNNIYEQVRLGKTQVKDAEIQANEIVQGAGGSEKFRTGYASYVKNLNVDDIYSFMQNQKYDNIKVTPKTVDKALELIDEAKKLDPDLEFGINFAQAYKNINKGVDEPFTKNYQTGGFTRMRKIVEDILQWKKKNDPDFVDSKDSTYISNPVRFSDDGTKLEVIVRKDTAEFYSTYKKLFSDSDQAILDGFRNDVIQSGGFASTDSGARFRVEGLISRYLYNALGIDKKTKVSKATQSEIIENLKDVDKEKLAQVIKLDRKLKLKLSQAKELGIDLDDFNLSHMEDVASNWMNSLNANNLFFAPSKANKSLQKNINRKIKNNLEKGKKAKTEAEKTEILNEFNDLKQQLIDNNLVSVIDGQKIGADIDFEKSFEIMSTVYDEAINKRLFPFKKDGGIVGIDYMTRPLNAQR